ncbi:MAG: hypothetical protein CM15mP111_0670 [Hyphomicrobiales bacterium]|nr:MAG: hypothetical protein CM15mP111_0670 [Hyphomicrobiales bacterium]
MLHIMSICLLLYLSAKTPAGKNKKNWANWNKPINPKASGLPADIYFPTNCLKIIILKGK